MNRTEVMKNSHSDGLGSLSQDLVQHSAVTSAMSVVATSFASVSATSPIHLGEIAPSDQSTTAIVDGGLATSTDAFDCPDLVCSICLELLYKPISVNPCGHVFCERCVRRYLETSLSKITCPLCREIIVSCQPAEERSHEVRQKYPTQFAERQKSEQNNNGQQFPPLWLYNYRLLTIDRTEPDSPQPSLNIDIDFDYTTWWRTMVLILWLSGFGFLMVFSLNSFLNQAIHGVGPHQMPSHPHVSSNVDELSSSVLLDGSDDEGFTSTHSASTGDTVKHNYGDMLAKSDYARYQSVAKNTGISSDKHFFHNLFIIFLVLAVS